MTEPTQTGARGAALLRAVEALIPAMQARAAALDSAGAFPSEDIAALAASGLLIAPLPEALGGLGAGTEPGGAELARALLIHCGAGNPSVARLFEAHLNALRLIVGYGDDAQISAAAADTFAGHLFGLWVTDPAAATLRVASGLLQGSKGPCSGAGHCRRAVVTAERGGSISLFAIALTGAEPVRPVTGLHGMRAACNGTVVLDGIASGKPIGAPGDYLREPDFSCGAWRGSAAALGALEALVEAARTHLLARAQDTAPLQQARFGELLIARDTARLWVAHACTAAEQQGDAARQVATVNLARIAVEHACLDAISHVQRGLGLAAFLAPHPAERLMRDLATYLRQPAADAGPDRGRRALPPSPVLTAGEAIRRMETLPFGSLDAILGGRTPFVLAPHPDDESLGCGGLLAACAARGLPAAVLVLTDGAGSHPGSAEYPPPRLRALREREARTAVAALGLDPAQIDFLRIPDTKAPMQGPEFDAAVRAIVARMPPHAALLAPWQHDPHCDHEAAHFMAEAAARQTGVLHLSYPVWGWTLPEATPLGGDPPQGWRLDIAPFLELKRAAIAAHASQHGGLIQDDPGGFSLPAAFLARFDQPWETYLHLG